MRSAILLLGLGLLAPALAAPATPALFPKDPMSIHKRVFPPPPPEDACEAVCGLPEVESGMTERDALCSYNGLQSTLDCATCIDITWTDTTWEDSALAEYHRIVETCQETDQKTFRQSSL